MLTSTLTLVVALMAQAAPQASPPPAATPASDAMVCRSITETGTRFTHRECHTASQWRAISDDAQQQVQSDQRMSSQSPH